MGEATEDKEDYVTIFLSWPASARVNINMYVCVCAYLSIYLSISTTKFCQ